MIIPISAIYSKERWKTRIISFWKLQRVGGLLWLSNRCRCPYFLISWCRISMVHYVSVTWKKCVDRKNTVIFLTARASNAVVWSRPKRRRRLVFVKPFRPQELLARIRELHRARPFIRRLRLWWSISESQQWRPFSLSMTNRISGNLSPNTC
jgi:hypothetical protein